VTLAELGVDRALALIAASLGFTATTVEGMLAEFDAARLPRTAWTYQPG
jgi:glutamyl-tRNA synthetase